MQLHILFLTGAELGRGRAQPWGCPLLPTVAAPQGGECVLAAPQPCYLQKVLSEKKKKIDEAKMNNSIII